MSHLLGLYTGSMCRVSPIRHSSRKLTERGRRMPCEKYAHGKAFSIIIRETKPRMSYTHMRGKWPKLEVWKPSAAEVT